MSNKQNFFKEICYFSYETEMFKISDEVNDKTALIFNVNNKHF